MAIKYNNSSKGLCYKLYKKKIEFEPNLDILTYKNKITFCKFRTGNHRLPIETGRWHGIDHGNRLCNICTDAEIGDECHYILQCKSLSNERKLYLSHYFSHRITTLKFGQLFQIKINQNQISIYVKLANSLYNCLNYGFMRNKES
jgi:hypothetical protein